MRRGPGFTAVALLMLALGLGANTAIFSVVSPILFEPLPFPNAGRIVQIRHRYKGETENGLSGTEAMYVVAHQRSFSSAAIVDAFGDGNLTSVGGAWKVAAVRVTSGFFKVWGVEPARGRDFLPEDDQPGSAPTAILSDGLWHSLFAARPDVAGRTFTLNSVVYTVIGVMPASFINLEQNGLNPEPTDLWTEMQPTAGALAPLGPNLDVIGRLLPTRRLEQAQADLNLQKAGFNHIYPRTAAQMEWGLLRYQDTVAEGVRTPLLLLLGAVGLVLLIACANLANLLLARAASRRREMAVRAALGASQGRILRQLWTESALLAALGAGLGWLLAWWSVPLLARMAPAQLALPIAPRLDGAALGYTAGLAAATALLFGLAPALSSRRLRLQEHLKESAASAGGGSSQARNALVVAEVGLAFLLLTGAALLADSLVRLNHVNPGFDLNGVVTAQTTLNQQRSASDAAATRYADAMVQRLEQIPGVESAASITGVPLTRAMNYPVIVPGHREDPFSDDVEWRAISPDFFQALRIPIIAGRAFTQADTATSPKAAIISAAFARYYWPNGRALGASLGVPDPVRGRAPAQVQIVGVAGDIHENGLDTPPPFTLYVPQAQASDGMNALVNHWFGLGFIVRGHGDGTSAAVRQAFAAVDPDQPPYRILTLESLKGASLGRYRYVGTLLGVFSLLAAALGAIGIYGVQSFAVAQRTREIGICMALGAGRGRILGQFLRQALTLAVLGLTLGAIGAWFFAALLQSLLFGVAAHDPAVLAWVAGAVLAVAALAALGPAWRAARVDPLQALRQ